MSNRKPVYAFKDHGRHVVSAQVAGEEIARIRAERGVFFDKADLVNESVDNNAPLHPEFEWDDKTAADGYRIEQARRLIGSVVEIQIADPTERTPEPVRAFVSVQTAPNKYQFTTTTYALSEPDLRQQVIAQALSDIKAFERKYSAFINLARVMAEFHNAIAGEIDDVAKDAAE